MKIDKQIKSIKNEELIDSKSFRLIAVEILNDIETTGVFAEHVLDRSISTTGFTHRSDKNLLTKIIYGVLQERGHIDWLISKIYHKDFEKMEMVLKNILRCAIYQMTFLEKIPDFAICNEAVLIAKQIAPQGSALVNAICRNFVRQKEKIVLPSAEDNFYLWANATLSHPEWLIKQFVATYGKEEAIKLCKANNKIPTSFLRVNRLKTTPTELIAELMQDGIECQPTEYSSDGIKVIKAKELPNRTKTFHAGDFIMQDEASQLIAQLLAPRQNDTVLDLCAGKGIKTTHLAALMKNSGHITAVDMDSKKLQELSKLSQKLGAKTIETITSDANIFLGKNFVERFDKVLLDAPCSGTGTLRRNPEIKWRLQKTDISWLANTQRCLLNQAGAYVKKKGQLLYVTCSLLPQENDEVVKCFLEKNPEFKIVSPKMFASAKGFFVTLPHRTNTDGFFAACLERQ